MNKHVTTFIFVMLILGSVATYSARPAFADWLIDSSGTLFEIDPLVLGDNDVTVESVETSEPSETARPTESPEANAVNNISEQQQEQFKKREEKKREDTKTAEEKAREAAKQKLERKIELNKEKNKNIENEFELSSSRGELKVKQKTKLPNGKEKEMELKLKENETIHVDQEGGESVDIKVSKPGEIEIIKDKFKGKTRLPLSVNSNNELVVTRPDGTTKVVSVLPDEAVSKMMEHGVLVAPETVELTTNESGDPVYQVKQEASKKVFGLFVMKFSAVSEVSATDSSSITTVSTETSPWRRFLESLSR